MPLTDLEILKTFHSWEKFGRLRYLFDWTKKEPQIALWIEGGTHQDFYHMPESPAEFAFRDYLEERGVELKEVLTPEKRIHVYSPVAEDRVYKDGVRRHLELRGFAPSEQTRRATEVRTKLKKWSLTVPAVETEYYMKSRVQTTLVNRMVRGKPQVGFNVHLAQNGTPAAYHEYVAMVDRVLGNAAAVVKKTGTTRGGCNRYKVKVEIR